MAPKLTSTLSLPILALLCISLVFSIATLACAAQALRVFDSQQTSNPWLLPIWRGHFDLRGLRVVLAASAVTMLLDIAAVVALGLKTLIPQNRINASVPAPPIVTATTSLLAASLALPALVLPLVLNARAPARDTLQSWTCGWVASGSERQLAGVPAEFRRVCGENRFATYAPIALLLVHFALAAVSVLDVRRSSLKRGGADDKGIAEDREKMVELGEVEKSSPKSSSL